MKIREIFKPKEKRALEFSPDLLLSEGIDIKKLDKIKEKLIRSPLLANVALLVLAENESDQLEILESKELIQDFYARYPLWVVGIASNHEEAVSLVLQITEKCLAERGDCSLKEYLRWQ